MRLSVGDTLTKLKDDTHHITLIVKCKHLKCATIFKTYVDIFFTSEYTGNLKT